MVKIEKVKRGNKTFAVARDPKGRFVAFSKQLTKKFTFEKARDRFSGRNSFDINIRVTRLTNVTEFVDTSKRKLGVTKKERSLGVTMFQAQARVVLNGRTFVARSDKHTSRFSITKAMVEARERLIKQIAASKGVSYEEDDIIEIGEGILGNKVGRIEFSIVQFRKIKK